MRNVSFLIKEYIDEINLTEVSFVNRVVVNLTESKAASPRKVTYFGENKEFKRMPRIIRKNRK